MEIFWASIPPFWVPLIEDNPAFPRKFPSCLKNNTGLYNLVWSHNFLLPLSKLVPGNQIIWRAHKWSPQNPIWRHCNCSLSRVMLWQFLGARKEPTFSLYSNRWPLMSAYMYCALQWTVHSCSRISVIGKAWSGHKHWSRHHHSPGTHGSAKWNNLFRVTNLDSGRQGMKSCSV